MIDVGFKNFILSRKIISIMSPNTSKAKQLIRQAIEGHALIDCTHGKKTRALITLTSGHIILSSIKESSLLKRTNK